MSSQDRKIRILAIDDEEIYIHAIVGQLAQTYKIIIALNGREGLKIAQSDPPPDLILLDVMMPDMGGFEVCRQLKKDPHTKDIPVIFLTAMTQAEDEQKGLELGAVDYITKPISPPIMVTRIKTHLQLKKANDLLKHQNEILEQKVQERTKQLSLMNQSLSRFVPDEFLDFLQKESIIEVNLGDHVSTEMTVLFSDIRAFTTLSESMTPQQNFNFVNTYFSKVSPVIREHGGMIVKYLGDGMMAVFPRNANDAVQAGIITLKRVADYNHDHQQDVTPPIQVGIGIHFGHMMFGMVGEAHRIQGDAFSDNVNLTARIEQVSKYYGVSLVISEDIYHKIDSSMYHIRFLGYVKLKGKNRPFSIYEVYDADPEDLLKRKSDTNVLFEKGQQHYFAREFAAAVKCFTDVLTVLPDDVTTRHYLQRSSTCLLEGIPDDWQGIWNMDKK
jgi:two-component system, sensor histidine kinase ChiS